MNIPPAGNPRTLLETTKIGHSTIKVYIDTDEIYLQASGLKLWFPEKPNRQMQIVTRGSSSAARLLDDEATKRELVELGERYRSAVHSRIRRDWSKDSFAPDKRGHWHHPLFEISGTHFSCHHCEQTFPGKAVAEALWHCPSPDCDGSPIDIHSADAPDPTVA